VVLVNAFEDYEDRGSLAQMRALLATMAIRWPVVAGTPQLRRAFGGVRRIPAMFIYDQAGRQLAAFRRSERPPPTLEELRTYLSPP